MALFGSQDWAITKIRNVRHHLWDIPEAALATYNTIPPALRLPWNARITANVLNGYVIDEAGGDLVEREVRNSLCECDEYHLFNGRAFCTATGEDGFPSNYRPNTEEEMTKGIFGFVPKRLVLVLGSKVDEALRGIQHVMIQRSNSIGQLKFYIELEKITAKSRNIEMPSQTSDALGTRTRIRIKRGRNRMSF